MVWKQDREQEKICCWLSRLFLIDDEDEFAYCLCVHPLALEKLSLSNGAESGDTGMSSETPSGETPSKPPETDCSS